MGNSGSRLLMVAGASIVAAAGGIIAVVATRTHGDHPTAAATPSPAPALAPPVTSTSAPPAPIEPAPPTTAAITVSITPADAIVVADGTRLHGSGPYKLTRPLHTHLTLHAERAGYVSYDGSVPIDGASTAIPIVLNAVPPPTQPAESVAASTLAPLPPARVGESKVHRPQAPVQPTAAPERDKQPTDSSADQFKLKSPGEQ